MNVWDYLRGKKTYFTAIVMIIWAGLKAQGYIDESTYQLGLTVLGALGLSVLRMAINDKQSGR
jgi:hypothetical protein